MINYIIRRILYSIPLLLIVSFISFGLINLPPGDYMTTLQSELQSQAGLTRDESARIAEEMRQKYGLDRSFFIKYFSWLKNILIRGDFGYSFQYREPVSSVIWERLGWTLIISLSSFFFAVITGSAIGIYSAVNQYSIGDNIFTIFAFLGLSIPNFFLALLLLYFLGVKLGLSYSGGLFSSSMIIEPWGIDKFIDFLKHIWVPIVVIGTAGMARNMRVTRANLLDVLEFPYIQTARAKGLNENIVILKHALRNAIQPMIMFFGMLLPSLFTGSIVVSIVLSLPTTGPMFYSALTSQDMYLAGSFVLLLACLMVLGNLLADIVLAAVDPRIRYD